jgi:sec-independent protein translocase protein TatA
MVPFALALPFLGGVGVPELLIILFIVLLLFGPKRLPQLGKTLGKTMRSLREGVEGVTGELDEAEGKDALESKADAPAEKVTKAAAVVEEDEE